MATFGITDQGFIRPRLVDIKTIIEQSLIATFGANINLASQSIFGQLVGTFADPADQLWQAAEDAYNSEYPDTAFGASLDNVGAISGIPRLGATSSVAKDVKLYGTAGTLVPTGTQFSVQGSPTSVFASNSDVTLVAGQNSKQKVSFSAVPTVGVWAISLNGHDTSNLAYNANAAAVQAAVRELEFASGALVTGNYTLGFTIEFDGPGLGGLMIQPQLLVSNNTLEAGFVVVSVTTSILQAGIDQGAVIMTATATGPIIANAGTLINVVTPIIGLDDSLNITDAVVGRDVETDNAYRARRAETLQVAGAGTVEAIRSKLLEVDGVTAVVVFENNEDIPDLQGRPPHSFEAVVQGGDDQDIADEIWAVKPAGIKTDGSQVETIVDSQGQDHLIYFSRPTNLIVYVKLQLSVNSSYPANGDAAAIQNIVNAGNALGIGKEVVTIPYLISSLASIPGIEDAILLIGLAPDPTSEDNLPVAPNEIAVFDTSRVEVEHF